MPASIQTFRRNSLPMCVSPVMRGKKGSRYNPLMRTMCFSSRGLGPHSVGVSPRPFLLEQVLCQKRRRQIISNE